METVFIVFIIAWAVLSIYDIIRDYDLKKALSYFNFIISEAVLDEDNEVKIDIPLKDKNSEDIIPKDNIDKAIAGLDSFTKNYCVNYEKTNLSDNLVFNCSNCEFCQSNDTCLLKVFVKNHSTDKNALSNFGAMIH